METTNTFLFPEKLRSQKNELVMELVRGKEHTRQLQAIFDKIDVGDEGVALAEELVQKVLRSFTDSLEKISLCRTNNLGQIKKVEESADFVESQRKRPAEMMKDKRGCYKRRKAVVSWFIVSPTTEDGYAWRKYGQKPIQNSNHPRCYFRCTNKFDQDCKAQKQVQKVDGEGQIMYQTTYFGQHTCKDQTRIPTISNYDDEVPQSTSMIDFRVKVPTMTKDHSTPPRNKTFEPSITKQESINGDTQSDVTDNVSSIDSNVMWPNVEDYSPKMGSFLDQEVASTLYERDESICLEGLDIKNLISDAFPEFSYEDL